MAHDWDLLRASYKKQGFVIVRDLIPKAEIETVLNDFNDIITLKLSLLGLSAHTFINKESLYNNMKLLHQHDVKAYLGCLKIVPKLASLQGLFNNKWLINALQNVIKLEKVSIPTGPVFHVMSEKLKIPNGYFGFKAHQDWSSVQGGLNLVVAWLPLIDVNVNNFPILVLPESHKKGLLPGEITDNEFKIRQDSLVKNDFIEGEVNMGDVILMSGFTVHKSSVEGKFGLRLATSCRFENVLEKSFSERNYPCAYLQSVHRELYISNFPTNEDVEKAFVN